MAPPARPARARDMCAYTYLLSPSTTPTMRTAIWVISMPSPTRVGHPTAAQPAAPALARAHPSPSPNPASQPTIIKPSPHPTHSMPPSPLSPHHDPGATPRPVKKHKKTKSSRTGSSKKSGSSAVSFSVPSPSVEGFPGMHEPAVASNEGQAFEGVPDDLQELPTAHAIATFPDMDTHLPSSGLPSPGLASPATTFPGTGLGGRRSGKSDLGAFLASR